MDYLAVIYPLLFISVLAALIGILAKMLGQPSVIAYILTGAILGPFGIGLVGDEKVISLMGEFGLIFLLFFIGMEINVKDLVENWRINVLGTLLQVGVSVLGILAIGLGLGWDFAKIVLYGFIISLSSTAVVLKLLEGWGEAESKTARNVIGILLTQDLIVVPMLILLKLFFGGGEFSFLGLLFQILGAALVGALVYFLVKSEEIRLPLGRAIKEDIELQIFLSFSVCFAFAAITSLFGFSPSMGAFLAGLFVARAKETEWVKKSMESFKVSFLAIFFVSVGFLLDLKFLFSNLAIIAAASLAVLLLNNLINSGILLYLGESVKDSAYAGALLSQIGEFSFVLASFGLSYKILDLSGHQMIVAVIAATLVLSPFWINLVKFLFRINVRYRWKAREKFFSD